ncbi:MAG: bifunctional metallophosphatase/5'-nucleotidase [Myxococcaceae bacterium]
MRLPLPLALVAAVLLVPLAPARAAPQTVLVLVTGDENGHLLPSTEGEPPKGGAAEVLGYWTSKEGHCPGKIARDGAPACKDGKTLVLSTGDHFSGPSISSFFQGAPVAEAMARMGYAASAMGNHELDFGREQFDRLRDTGGFPYLSSNVRPPADKKDKEYNLGLKPFTIFQRGGVKIGVVGLSAGNVAKTVMSGRFYGNEVVAYEPALQAAIPAVRKAGADVVIVIADECPTVLEPIVAKHPDWKLALLAGGHCHTPVQRTVGTTPLVSPGRRWEKYLRAELTVDASRPAGQRLVGLDAKIVDVVGGQGAPAADAELNARLQTWVKKHDEALGEKIGYTRSGIDANSATLYTWYTRAIRTRLGTDVVMLNKKAFRGGVSPGPITPGNVYTVMPFDDSLLTVRIKGKDLAAALDNPAAVYDGASKRDGGGWSVKGKALDPEASYTVGTFEYLYFGGDNFPFERMDPSPGETGVVAQTPVIEWTRQQRTTQDKPLESLLH